MPVELRSEETYSDRYDWQNMAKARGIRLPMWRFPCTTGGMRRWLKKLNVPVEEYLAYSNESNLRIFGQHNPDWPLRAWCGLILEWLLWRDKKPEEVVIPRRKRGRPRKVIDDIGST